MRLLRILGALLTACMLFSGTAFAEYQSSQDVTLSVNLLPNLVSTSGSTGQTTFAVQEAVHSTLTSTTGQSVDHCYIWINVNGQPVLAVDPMTSYSVR